MTPQMMHLLFENPVNPELVPEHIRESLDDYHHRGVPLGSFLQAVVANDLVGAVERADHENMRLLPAIAGYVRNELNYACWGSYRIYNAWVAWRKAQKGESSAEEHKTRAEVQYALDALEPKR